MILLILHLYCFIFNPYVNDLTREEAAELIETFTANENDLIGQWTDRDD